MEYKCSIQGVNNPVSICCSLLPWQHEKYTEYCNSILKKKNVAINPSIPTCFGLLADHSFVVYE